MAGPLAGIRVIELKSVGPGPFAAMLLSDLGADVIQIDRPTAAEVGITPEFDVLSRGRRSVVLDLKAPEAVDVVLRLAAGADVFIEGYRPGVAERLGLGPDVVAARNPTLVYGRMTGWGQHGPLAHTAGHDINYLALSGMLHPLGRPESPPVPPLNLVGDFGGGGALLAMGVLGALVERGRSGLGQVVDAAMLDGAAQLGGFLFGMLAEGTWSEQRGVNVSDGGAPYYDCYETADGRWIAVGAIEQRFWGGLVEALDLPREWVADQHDITRWPPMKARLRETFLSRSRDQWVELLAPLDVCVSPVLAPSEAPRHPHNRERGVFTAIGGVQQPAPAPRFSRSATAVAGPPMSRGSDTTAVLREAGLTEPEITALLDSRAAHDAHTGDRL